MPNSALLVRNRKKVFWEELLSKSRNIQSERVRVVTQIYAAHRTASCTVLWFALQLILVLQLLLAAGREIKKDEGAQFGELGAASCRARVLLQLWVRDWIVFQSEYTLVQGEFYCPGPG